MSSFSWFMAGLIIGVILEVAITEFYIRKYVKAKPTGEGASK